MNPEIINVELYLKNFESLVFYMQYCFVQQKISHILKHFFVGFRMLQVSSCALLNKVLKALEIIRLTSLHFYFRQSSLLSN